MDNAKLVKFLTIGSEITGGIVGGAVGLIGGVEGVLLGGTSGVVVSKGITEMINRTLSDREKIRVSATTCYSIVEVQKRLEKGDLVRDDGFFDDSKGRSKASELFEGVLIKSKNEYQEKKIKFISNIFSNVIFDENISSENSSQILSVAEQLTYNEMCILSLIECNQTQKFDLRNYDYRPNFDYLTDVEIPLNLQFLLQSFMDLYLLGLIHREDNAAIIDIADVVPSEMKLSKIGKRYYEIMGLNEIDFDDLVNMILPLQDKNFYMS